MQLEICTNSFQSAKIAAEGGANRVELCQSLESGGVTPSAGDIRLTVGLKAEYDFKVYVLIRPRNGDFCYDKQEVEVMRQDIIFCKEAGADGVVIGASKPNGEIDVESIRSLIEVAGDLGLVFHRAFDLTPNPLHALEQIIDLGFERILTSGQELTVVQGKEFLRNIIQRAGNRIEIMPGSGVNSENVVDVLQSTAAQHIHLSAREKLPSKFSFEQNLFEGSHWQTSQAEMKKLKMRLDVSSKA